MGSKLEVGDIKSLLMSRINELDKEIRELENLARDFGYDPINQKSGLLHDANIYRKALADFRDFLSREERKKGV